MRPSDFLPILFFLVSTSVIALPTAKITVKVIDEQGEPIAGANTGIGFRSPKNTGWGSESNRASGVSDDAGMFSAKDGTEPYLSFTATKEGYYGTGGKFNAFTGISGIYGFRKYEPWNPTVELVLKKIINPIPMYAVRMSAGRGEEYPDIPVLDRFVGFDLEANDWVVPHGLGTHRDFLFKINIERAVDTDNYDVTLTLKFSNPGDGLIKYTPDVSKGQSMLRFPHNAPITGYTSELIQHYEHTPGIRTVGTSGNPEFETNYFFRVRSELDEDGNVIGGLYGKIHGQIELGNFAWLHSDKPYLSFNYYLNPNNNDTNIEYAPEKNLFKGVPNRKKVSEP